MKSIKLTKIALTAISRTGPSDDRLIEILQTESTDEINGCRSQEAKWMAGHILEMNGYKLEE